MNSTQALRITSGTAKNRRIKAPVIEGYRAVQEVAKLAVFSILEDKVVDADCLDLFAGSGNMGLEALSRGAQSCVFVDEHYEAIKAIRQNIELCGFTEEQAISERAEAVKYAANTDKSFDLIFADPFYSDTHHIFLFSNLEQILNKNGVIVFFSAVETDVHKLLTKTQLSVQDERRFGKSKFSLIS